MMNMKKYLTRRFTGRKAMHNLMTRFLLSALLSLLLTNLTFADILYLNGKGAEALKGSGLVKPHPDGRRYFVRGQIVILRDGADRPTLKSPGTYFLFRPQSQNSQPQLEWSWVVNIKHQIDTLDDLRSILSNRDKQYGNWQEAFKVLITEADPSSTLGLKVKLKGNAPPASSKSVAPREGWFSQFLLRGPLPASERTARVRAAKDKGPLDPLGYSPIDPLWQQQTPESTMTQLLEAIARAEKYGEPESGFLAACREAAQFLCETTLPPAEAETGPDGERARDLRAFALGARATLLSTLESAGTEAIRIRLRRAAASASPADALLVTNVEDELRLDVFDVAKAALTVLGELPMPQTEDKARVVEALFSVVAGYAVPATANGAPPLPQAVAGLQQEVGQKALATLISLASVSSAGGAERGFGFREEFVVQLSRAPSAGYAQAVSEAILKSGIGSFREIAQLVKGLFTLGTSLTRFDNDTRPRALAYLVNHLADSPLSESFRATVRSAIAKEIRDLEKRQEIGTGGESERRFLDLLRSVR
jgi:hypothetical protein